MSIQDPTADDATTIEEAHCGAMGIILGVLDTAREMGPPPGTTPRDALDHFVSRAQECVRMYFGPERWDAFVKECRRIDSLQRINPN